MTEKSETPQVRFKRFTGEWRKWKIGDILTEKKCSIELDDKKEYKLVTVKRRNEGVVSRGVLKGKNILVKSYFEIEEGDYIISKRQVVHGANGLVPKSLNKAIVSNEYLVSTGNENITNEFWALLSKLPDMYRKFFISSYGVDIEKLVFDVEDWKKRTVIIPPLCEQKKIIGFFNHLDLLINHHQQKHNKLITLKKAMLDKMLPREDADVPEIRFKGYIGAWKEKKLGHVSDSFSGGTPSVGKEGYYGGDIPFIRSAEINSELTELFLTEEGLKESSAKLVDKGDILYALYGATSGITGRARIKGAINQAILAIIPREGYNAEFIMQWLRNKRPEIIATYLQGGQGNLSGAIVKELRIEFPCFEEQQKIGTYFQNLDNLITLRQSQLAKLKNIKNACFEKMFI